MRLAAVTVAAVVAATIAGGTSGSASHRVHVRDAKVDGHGVKWWAQRARENGAGLRWQKKRVKAMSRRLERTVSPMQHAYEHAAVLAAIAYGVSADTLIRKGRCESGNWTAFTNTSSGAAGPWQFLWSTWRSTPFGAFDPYDPLAAALGAAWMHANGRGGEWVCR